MADKSRELIRRLRAGDDDAWADLYLRYRDGLLLAIRCRLGPALRQELDSEDVLHSVVRDALDDFGDFEPRGPGALARFLHVCVLNKLRNKARHYGAQKRSAGTRLSASVIDRLPGRGESSPDYLANERYGRLEGALRQLPEPMREAILLRSVEELSNAEAAEVLGRSPAATSKLYGRALARLATLAEPESL